MITDDYGCAIMRTYEITDDSGNVLGEFQAEAVWDENNDVDTGFDRGGDACDAETYGEKCCSVLTDGGRVYATVLPD